MGEVGPPHVVEVLHLVGPPRGQVGRDADAEAHGIGRDLAHRVPRVGLRQVVDLAATLPVRVGVGSVLGLVAHQTTAFLRGSRFVVVAPQ